MVIKKCIACGEDKPHKAHNMCGRCYAIKYRLDHPDRIKASAIKYAKDNRVVKNERERIRRIEKAGEIAAQRTECNRHKGIIPYDENKTCTLYLGVFVAERVLSRVFKDVIKMPARNPGYDFICNKGKKIDVKSSTMSKGGRWSFHINKNTLADYFLCLSFDNRNDLNPIHMWLIPGRDVNVFSGISTTTKNINKWDEYKLNIDKVSDCCDILKGDK